MHLTRPDDQIVRLIGRMYFVVPEQVTTRFYSAGAKTRVQSLLKGLAERGILVRDRYGLPMYRGTDPYVYRLWSGGHAYLSERGLAPHRWKPSEQTTPRPSLLPHTLAVNDVLIALERLQDPYRLVRFVHERDFRKRPSPVNPDAYIEVVGPDARDGYLLEIDMGTEQSIHWKKKVERLINFVGTPAYESACDSQGFSAVIVVAPDKIRALELERWTLAELSQLRLPHWRELFRFTTMDVATDPERLPTIL